MGSTVGSALLPIQWEDEEEEEEVSDQASVPLDQSTSIVFNFKVLNLLSRQKQTDLLRFRHNPMSGCETRVPVFLIMLVPLNFLDPLDLPILMFQCNVCLFCFAFRRSA